MFPLGTMHVSGLTFPPWWMYVLILQIDIKYTSDYVSNTVCIANVDRHVCRDNAKYKPGIRGMGLSTR